MELDLNRCYICDSVVLRYFVAGLGETIECMYCGLQLCEERLSMSLNLDISKIWNGEKTMGGVDETILEDGCTENSETCDKPADECCQTKVEPVTGCCSGKPANECCKKEENGVDNSE